MKIFVLTDEHTGVVGAYPTEELALKAAEDYEDKTWASAGTREEYEADYPNGEITFGQYLVNIHDYTIEEVEYYGE